MAQFFSTGVLDTSQWYKMWEGMTALFSMCIRNRMGGVCRGLGISFSQTEKAVLIILPGDHGHIFLSVKSRPSLALPGGTASGAQA